MFHRSKPTIFGLDLTASNLTGHNAFSSTLNAVRHVLKIRWVGFGVRSKPCETMKRQRVASNAGKLLSRGEGGRGSAERRAGNSGRSRCPRSGCRRG